jgi:hypothetical protein
MGFAKENQMGEKAALRRPIVAFAVLVGTAIVGFAAPAASASIEGTKGIIAPSDPTSPTLTSGWQAGTCTKDKPDTAEQCSVLTTGQFFEQASGHPQVGFTQFIVKHTTEGLLEKPAGEVKTVRVDLPVGLSVNPGATERCPLAKFQEAALKCELEFPGSRVGESLVTTSLAGVVTKPQAGITQVPVYNVVPKQGEASRFGLELAGNEVFLEGDVAWDGDYHEGFTIHVPRSTDFEPLISGVVLKNRLPFNGRSGDGTFITTPATCLGEAVAPHEHDYSTYLLASSWVEEEEAGYKFPASAAPAFESRIPPLTSPKECATIPYDPAIALDPKTAVTDSPSGATTEVSVPFITGGTKQETSPTKEARLALPTGVSLNPSAANGLQACTDAQFGKGTKQPVTCPPESKIGTVKIESPPLPEGALEGDVFVGQQLSRDPASGDEYRIFVDAESARYGISVRLIGHVVADPASGQLTTTFSGLPQVPFTSLVIQLNGGSKATLTSPPICGPHTTTATMTPWSGNADAKPTTEFTLTSAPGGASPCPNTLAERPFAPKFEAQGTNPQAGAYTDVNMDIVRDPGSQELKGADVKLPQGLTAKLAGLRYCPEEAIAAAAANSGVAETASPSCPPDSLVGVASIASGSGPEPFHIETGKAFLSGPYHGAPLSLAVITPATAGPFDLGTVVVRVALFLDPKTARVTAITDPIPHIYGGALLDVRSVSVKVNRPQFGLNPTNCSASAFEGTLRGGGADPADAASFTSVGVSSPFQVSGCENLGFRPKLFLRAFGGMKRTKKPKLRAILVARPGDANIQRAVVTLPKSLILEQANIGTVCTRVQFAAKECPAGSVYGFAEATTPLLDGPLKGPVYLRSNPEHVLPDLVTALHGQVDVELTGVTDTTKQGRLRNTFEAVPDVPVSKFVLTVRGGKRGLLVNTRDLCRHKQFSRLELTGQNGAQLVKKKLRVRTACKGKKRHQRRRGHGAG